MNFQEIQARLTEMNDALIEKGYSRPDCDLSFDASSSITVWVRTSSEGSVAGKTDWVERDGFEAVLDAADDLIEDYESVDDHKKKEAVKQFGRAVDGLRGAGFDAEFTDPLSDQLKALNENLLTHQLEAVS